MVRQAPRGALQIASVHTYASMAGASPYDAAKHGMVGFSKAAAIELAREGVRINVLSPGLCRTEIWRELNRGCAQRGGVPGIWARTSPLSGWWSRRDRPGVRVPAERLQPLTGANIMADLGMTASWSAGSRISRR